MITLRPYQEDISTRASLMLKEHGIVMLAMEVRTGKTITALSACQKYGSKKVLFLTKKKAIPSIKEDYKLLQPDFEIEVINYESMQKAEISPDIVVCDESHTLGTFPKPSNKQKNVKKLFGNLPIILMSGTPNPESYSQIFHQFYTNNNGPFSEYKGRYAFYNWAKDGYVKIYEIRTSYGLTKKYNKANYDKIMEKVGHLIITFTQVQAGFETSVEEEILHVKMSDKIYSLADRLKKDKIIEYPGKTILADTMVKEKSKIHQLFSGTIKTEEGQRYILDSTKGIFIKNYFKGKKIAIFYNFKAEKDLLFKVFKDDLTEDLQEFRTTGKNIALQIVSGREGISLKEADFLVFFNISFSSTSYWQARDRLTTKDRSHNKVYWIFSQGGLEDEIYKSVLKKKTFTTKMYEKLC